MAGADYLHCGVCGAKAIYDADLDYESAEDTLGSIVAICRKCDIDYTIKIELKLKPANLTKTRVER